MTPSLDEAILDLLLRRYQESASAAASPGTLATVLAGPHVGRGAGLPTPRLTVTFGATARRLSGVEGEVENRLLLELTLDDAASSARGEASAMRLALRWAAWIEAVLVPEAERTGPHLDGLVQGVEPVDTFFEAGGPGLGAFTLRLRFVLVTATLLGGPCA